MKLLKRIIISLFSATALATCFYNIYDGGIKQLKSIANVNDFPLWFWSVCFILIFFSLLFFYKKEVNEEDKYARNLVVLFTFFLIIGNGYELYGSFLELFKGYHLVLMIINMFGYYFFLRNLVFKIKEWISNFNKHNKKLRENKIVILFSKRPFLFCIVTLAISWSIYYVAFYPIVLSPDPSFQIKQYLGEKTKYMNYSILIDENVTITNHHPVFHTVLLGSCLKFGRIILNDNFGLFIYSFLQGVCLAMTLARTIVFLKKKGINIKYLLLMLFCYALVPIFPLYAINGNKDVFYTICFINLIVSVFDFVSEYKKKKYHWKKSLGLMITSLLLCLFRNNGAFVIVPVFIALLLYSKDNLIRMLLISVGCLGIYSSFEYILIPKLGIAGTSIRESMSIFFQQTAREIKYFENDISAKDREAISKVIDYEKAKKNYNPVLADPVKNTFNRYATSGDIINYLVVWGKGLLKHPLIYIDATLNNTYGYFDPEEISWNIYVNYDDRVTQNNLVDYHYNSCTSLRKILTIYGGGFAYIPIIGLICNIGISTWLVIAAGVYLFKTRKEYLIVLIPFVISILMCLASPVNTYFRYAMPVVFSELLLVGMWGLIVKNKKS